MDSLTNNGHDFSYGLGVSGGIWYGGTDNSSVGVSDQAKMSMSSFDKYSDLFAEGGGFDIPSSAKLGLSFGGAGPLRLHIDVEHTMYSDVASINNPMQNLLGCPTTASAQNPNPNDPESCLGGGRFLQLPGPGHGLDEVFGVVVRDELQGVGDGLDEVLLVDGGGHDGDIGRDRMIFG